MSFALILTYHAVERGPAPLCVDPALFEEHLDCIVASGARVETVRQLAETLQRGTLRELTVAITFDDGFVSVVEEACPLLARRGLAATIFCVAGRLGGRSDWPSARQGSFEAALAPAADLAELARQGFEIGSHGMEHEPLVSDARPLLERELIESKHVLEEAIAAPVTSYAFPYGAGPSVAGRRLVESTYDAACTTTLGAVHSGADPLALPRVDVHYVRSPERLGRALEGSLDGYLRLRQVGSRLRRALRKDYALVSRTPVSK